MFLSLDEIICVRCINDRYNSTQLLPVYMYSLNKDEGEIQNSLVNVERRLEDDVYLTTPIYELVKV